MSWSLFSTGMFLLAVAVVPWIDGIALLAALAVIVVVGLITPQRAVVRSSWRGLLCLPLLLSLLLLPPLGSLLLETANGTPGGGAPFSGMLPGIWMALRFISLFMAGAVFSAHVTPFAVARLLERLGLNGLGFALGLALNALPAAVRAVDESWQALRLRGGLRRPWWPGLRLFMVNATVRVVCQGEEVLQAAQLRGHGVIRPKRAPRSPLRVIICADGRPSSERTRSNGLT